MGTTCELALNAHEQGVAGNFERMNAVRASAEAPTTSGDFGSFHKTLRTGAQRPLGYPRLAGEYRPCSQDRSEGAILGVSLEGRGAVVGKLVTLGPPEQLVFVVSAHPPPPGSGPVTVSVAGEPCTSGSGWLVDGAVTYSSVSGAVSGSQPSSR
jgi:hypothetical protein